MKFQVHAIEGEDGLLHIAIRDTGIGIAEEKQQAIFEAFQQEDSSTTRKYGGTGLGLSICQQLAHLMDGTILVSSKQGKGSTFTLKIPLEPVGSETQTIGMDSPLRGSQVLLIGTKPALQSSMKNAFTCLGMHSISFSSVADLEDDMLDSIDLIVVDEPSIRDVETLDSWSCCPLFATTRGETRNDARTVSLSKPVCLEEVRGLARIALGYDESSGSIELPASQGQSSGPRNKLEQRILVADDCEVNQQVATGLLEIQGFDVQLASTGIEVLEAVEASEFDLILMDVEMPEMDGREATRRIRETSDIPILALSAHTVDELEKRCQNVGFNGFISKPFQPEDLVEKIHAALASTTSTTDAKA